MMDGESDQIFARDGDYAASHILVAWQGAKSATTAVQNTPESALQKARLLLERVLDDPSQFQALARTESDGASAALSGNLGSWKEDQFVPALEAVIKELAPNEIATRPIKTKYGYHIIRRDALEVMHYAADGFFICSKEHAKSPAKIQRSLAEAQRLAQMLENKVTAANFEDMAKQYNDRGEGAQFMGIMRAGDPLPAGALATLAALDYGEVAGPVAFPIGIAFMRRSKVEQFSGANILISYQGAEAAKKAVTRTKKEALSMTEDLLAQLKQKPTLFSEFAHQHSDGPSAHLGGELGVWFKGLMLPEFRTAFEQLKADQITEKPVATKFGYFIIRRNRLP